ncbi:MAG: preprotein translocase subunit YajC [Bacteroidaceae bacterium]|nr:preprotein translocase subunit YajC [Bacteroidaceae bacterium]
MANYLFINPATGFTNQCEINENVLMTGVDLSEPASASEQGAQKPMGGGMIWFLVLMVVMMLLLGRPRKDKEGDKFRNSLQEGQEIITSSGIVGTIKAVEDLFVTVEVNQNIRLKIDKRYVNPLPTPAPVPAPKEKKSKKAKETKDSVSE